MVRRDARTRIALRRDPYGNLSAQQTGDLSRQGIVPAAMTGASFAVHQSSASETLSNTSRASSSSRPRSRSFSRTILASSSTGNARSLCVAVTITRGNAGTQHVNDTRNIFIRERGDKKCRAAANIWLGLIQRGNEVLAALRVMARVNEHERIGTHHIKTSGYGASIQALL